MSRVEVKVWAASAASLLASLAIAVLNAALGNSELLGPLPPWLQFVLITTGPVLVTFLGGFAKGSTTSQVSDFYRSGRVGEPPR